MNLAAVGSVTYSFPGARVHVQFETTEHEPWLDEVLQPAFVRVPDDPRATVVRVVDGLDDLPGRVRVPLGRVPCFVFDGEVVHHEAWEVDGRIEIADAKYCTRYRVGSAGVDIEMVEGDPESRGALLRVVREVALAQSLVDASRVLLHASAIGTGRDAVVFSGEKEAGKTTLAARLASVGDGVFFANDCTLVEFVDAAKQWQAHSVPLVVSVRAGTVERLPELFTTIPAVPRPQRLTLAEADNALARHGPYRDPERLRLTPPQFARALGAELGAAARLACIAFVRVDGDVRDFTIDELDADSATSRLRTAAYGERGSAAGRTVFEQQLGVRRPVDADEQIMRRIGREVRCVELRVGAGVLEHDDVARALRTDLCAR